MATHQRGTCPLLRVVARHNEHRHVGQLTNTEFDLIDYFMMEERSMMIEGIAARMGVKPDSFSRYIRHMRNAGTMGICEVRRMSFYRDVPGTSRVHGMSGQMVEYEDFGYHQEMPINFYGPTMKGLMLWHAAMNEDWEWEKYAGQEWVALESVQPGGAGGSTPSPYAQRSMAIDRLDASEAS
jgi:hypothetical protein